MGNFGYLNIYLALAQQQMMDGNVTDFCAFIAWKNILDFCGMWNLYFFQCCNFF